MTTSEPTRAEQLRTFALDAINECNRLHYRPTYWERMLKERGALDAHKQVLRPGQPHEGFVRLAFLMNPPHPELTAEYAALYKFPDLFTEDELAVARQRLE